MEIIITEQGRTHVAYRRGMPDALGNPDVSESTLTEFIGFLSESNQNVQVTDAVDEEQVTLSSFHDAGIEAHRLTVDVGSADYAELSAYLADYFGPETAA